MRFRPRPRTIFSLSCLCRVMSNFFRWQHRTRRSSLRPWTRCVEAVVCLLPSSVASLPTSLPPSLPSSPFLPLSFLPSLSLSQGFLFATGVRHFSAQLQRGNVRALQALCAPPEAIVLCSPEWMELARLVDPVALQQKSFVEHCLGQVGKEEGHGEAEAVNSLLFISLTT